MNTKFLTITCAGLLYLTIGLATSAMARDAKCLITSGGVVEFQGVCDFEADAKGSFSLSPSLSTGRFLKEVEQVSVYILKKGQADVRGLTKSGINSRWGYAKRSRRDGACWVGEDFKICAW